VSAIRHQLGMRRWDFQATMAASPTIIYIRQECSPEDAAQFADGSCHWPKAPAGKTAQTESQTFFSRRAPKMTCKLIAPMRRNQNEESLECGNLLRRQSRDWSGQFNRRLLKPDKSAPAPKLLSQTPSSTQAYQPLFQCGVSHTQRA